MGFSPTPEILNQQHNLSFKAEPTALLFSNPTHELSAPKSSQMPDAPLMDRALLVPTSVTTSARMLQRTDFLHVDPIEQDAFGHKRRNEKGIAFPTPALRTIAACESPMGGLLDLSNTNLSENELRGKMDPRHCNATMDNVREFRASRNNLRMDLLPLISLLLKMKNVHTIDLSYNKITTNETLAEEVPIPDHSELLFLNLSHNPLSTLKGLSLPSNLKRIDLSFTYINHIPQAFAVRFFHIQEMYVQGNNFIYKPDNLLALNVPHFPICIRKHIRSQIDLPRDTPIESLPGGANRLVMSNCSIVELPEWFETDMKSLLFLDLSNNPMHVFPHLPASLQHLDLSHTGIQEIPTLDILSNLTVFKIQSNDIEDLLPGHLPISLKEFDVSCNKICTFPSLGPQEKLESLNVSGNCIASLKLNNSYPSLNNLDASHNLIMELHSHLGKFLPELEHLNLSGNKISFLQPGSLPESLLELDISNNAITTIMKETFGLLTNLNVLSVQGKHFYCNCDMYWFANVFLSSPRIEIHGRGKLFCNLPPQKRGLSVESSNLTILSCSLGLQMGITACVAILAMSIVTTLCWRFDALWYIKMGWYWCMAKRRQYKRQPEHKLYDAFVSYSEKDAPWTKEVLLEKLETNGLKVCYHERDFLPGHPVLGNIFHCIENSHKVLFVLSPGFVSSCWCQYELYFAEHRVLNENQDSLIMVVLEDLPPNSIPQKFSKLRKLLKRKTYLKWSPEEHRQRLFWHQLMAVLRTTNEPVVLWEENGFQREADEGVELKLHEC